MQNSQRMHGNIRCTSCYSCLISAQNSNRRIPLEQTERVGQNCCQENLLVIEIGFCWETTFCHWSCAVYYFCNYNMYIQNCYIFWKVCNWESPAVFVLCLKPGKWWCLVPVWWYGTIPEVHCYKVPVCVWVGCRSWFAKL
jgi:hypothetical protein